MTKSEVLSIVHALTHRKVQNKDIWKLLMQPLLKAFNEGTVSLREMANLTYYLSIVKLQSPKFFDIVVDYFLKKYFNERDLTNLGLRLSVNFIHSLCYSHGSLNNDAFF